MYTLGLVPILNKVRATGKSLADDNDNNETRDYTEIQQKTFVEFTRTIYELLLEGILVSRLVMEIML